VYSSAGAAPPPDEVMTSAYRRMEYAITPFLASSLMLVSAPPLVAPAKLQEFFWPRVCRSSHPHLDLVT